jgi:hypothetical protein
VAEYEYEVTEPIDAAIVHWVTAANRTEAIRKVLDIDEPDENTLFTGGPSRQLRVTDARRGHRVTPPPVTPEEDR